MTDIKKAKAHFDYGIKCDIFSEPVTSYAKMAISALEKQIPKKPGIPFDSIHQEYECPKCPHRVDKTQLYCDKCGQALDWSDTE